MQRAIVLFSGGQDSTTCLIQACQLYDDVHCITFNYGQRHYKEIDISIQLAHKLGIKKHQILDVEILKELAISSLTCKDIPIEKIPIKNTNNLPNTFVPGRNILFLTLASIYAYKVKAKTIITGVCETDFSGYPDCRNEFLKIFNHAVQLGMNYNIRFEMPIMFLNKAETWALADYWKQLFLIRTETLTCYNNIKGDGCGKCASCHLRAKGLVDYQNNTIKIMERMKKKIGLH